MSGRRGREAELEGAAHRFRWRRPPSPSQAAGKFCPACWAKFGFFGCLQHSWIFAGGTKLRFQHFAPTLGLGLRSKRGRSYGWLDNTMIEVHAECEAKRTRGVDEAERWQVEGGGDRGRRSTRRSQQYGRRNTRRPQKYGAIAEVCGGRRSTRRSQKYETTAEVRGGRRSARRSQKHEAVAEARGGRRSTGQSQKYEAVAEVRGDRRSTRPQKCETGGPNGATLRRYRKGGLEANRARPALAHTGAGLRTFRVG
jgi:hypothetical protein